MADRLYGRQLQVILGNRVFDTEGIEFEVEIEKDRDPEPNRSVIELINPSPETISTALALGDEQFVEISAGLDDSRALYFRGSVMPDGVSDTSSGSNSLEIEASDGGAQWRATRLNRTIRGGTSAEEIIRICADALGLPVRRISVPNDYQLEFGRVLNNQASKIMRETAEAAGANFSIQDGKIVVVPEEETSGRTAPLFSGENGTLLESTRTKKGVEATLLATDPLSPEDPFKLESRKVPGFYKADVVRTRLSSGDQDPWWHEVEAKRL